MLNLSSTPSRRSMLSGLVAAGTAVGAITLPAPSAAFAVTTNEDRAISDLSLRVTAAKAAHEVALDGLDRSKKIMTEWERRNPKPAMRDCEVKSVNWPGGPIEGGTPSYDAYMAVVDEANADLRAAMAEHLQASTVWRRRRDAAKSQAGIVRSEAAVQTAKKALSGAIHALCNVPATTLTGLVAKARAAEESQNVQESIIDDLNNLSEGRSHG